MYEFYGLKSVKVLRNLSIRVTVSAYAVSSCRLSKNLEDRQNNSIKMRKFLRSLDISCFLATVPSVEIKPLPAAVTVASLKLPSTEEFFAEKRIEILLLHNIAKLTAPSAAGLRLMPMRGRSV